MASSDIIRFLATEQKREDLRWARREEAFMDFKIRIGDDFLSCNKLVLANRSPYMKAMLTSGMTEVTNQEVRIDKISINIMNIILDYMYCCDVSFHKDQLMDIAVAAGYLHMMELEEFCIAEIQHIVTTANVISWWLKSNNSGVSNVIHICEKIMAPNIGTISLSSDFLALSLAQIELYVSDICATNTQSDDVLEAVMRWVSHDTDSRQSHLDGIMQYFDGNKCSSVCLNTVMKTYAPILNQQSLASCMQKFTLLNDPVTDEKPHRISQELCIIGGYNPVTRKTNNTAVWKISKANKIEKVCGIDYEGFTSRHSVCKTPNGFVITGGMHHSALCMMYNSSSQSWYRLPNMLVHRCGHGSICVKQTVYVFGGNVPDSSKISGSVDLFPMNGCTWKEGPALPFKLKFPKVSQINNGVFLLDENSNQLLHLDVDNYKWSHRSPLPSNEPSVYGVSMTAARGRLYVAGGFYRMCAWYRPCTDTWCVVQGTHKKHIYGSLVYNKDKLVLLGGSFKSNTEEIEEYNIEEGTWSLCSYKMPASLMGHCGLVLDLQNTDV